MRTRALLTAALLSVAGLSAAAPAAGTGQAGGRGAYVVQLAGSADGAALRAAAGRLGGRIGFTYEHALHGFSLTLPVAAVPALSGLPGVLRVQPDRPLALAAVQPNPPSYGLDRVDQRSLPLSRSYRYTGTGAGVTAYVLDTGLTYSHLDVRGRAVPGFDAVTAGGGSVDCHGHGTHVAGTIGGTDVGVAKKVRLVGVRVATCSGSSTTSQLVAGIDWVVANHLAGRPAVANISITGGPDRVLDAAVQRLIQDGVTVGVAAGNYGSTLTDLLGWSDACDYSPGDVPEALTVASVDAQDTRAPSSAIGACVDLWAPGVEIVSDSHDSETGTTTMSGTSMASPHVVGTAAIYLSRHPRATPAQVAAALTGAATQGAVVNAGQGSPNRLLLQAW